MDPARPVGPHGRGALVSWIWNELLPKTNQQVKPLIAVLFGPRGIGKTTVLDELALRCRNQAAQPHSSVLDLAVYGDRPGWHAQADLAFELAEPRWPQFGRLKFPRLTLGTMVVGGHIADETPAEAHAAILDLLRQTPSQGQDLAAELVGMLPQLLGLPAFLEGMPDTARLFLGLKPLIKRFYKTGFDFYTAALATAPDSGLTALRKLARSSAAEADEVLAEAFLEDLRANYLSGFRPRECLVLLDNVHSPAGRRLLTALDKAGKRAPAPLLVVATSGRLDLALPEQRADMVSAWTRMATDREPPRTRGRSLLPVRLTPLTADEVTAMAAERFGRGGRGLGGFVAAVTEGHPWAVDRVLTACAQLGAEDREPTASELRGLLEVKVGAEPRTLGETAACYLVADDLPSTVDIAAAALARDLESATAALPTAANLPLDLAALCWVEPRSDITGTRLALPGWLRRVLLAAVPLGQSWTATVSALREHCDRKALPRAEALHYAVADGRPEMAIAYLNRRFDAVTAAGWIAEFDVITKAPRRDRGHGDAWAEHVALLARLRGWADPAGLPPGDPHGERLITVTSLVAAAWLGADPVRDPHQMLATVLTQGFHDLGRRSPSGLLRFATEASRYPR